MNLGHPCLEGYSSIVTKRNVREQVSVYWNIVRNILRFVLYPFFVADWGYNP